MRGSRSANVASETGAPGMKIALTATCSVEEVALAREHHGEPEFVGLFDDRIVAHRAARLDDRRDARRGRGLDPVLERVERVARAGAAAGASGRLLRRDLAGLDAVLLARADPDG